MDDLSKLLQNIGKQLETAKKEKKKQDREGKQVTGNGYIYEYDSEGRPRSVARRIVSEREGRPLKDFEVVMYRDGNKKNLAPDNLIIGWKAGIPLDFLQCRCCGARGSYIINPPEGKNNAEIS